MKISPKLPTPFLMLLLMLEGCSSIRPCVNPATAQDQDVAVSADYRSTKNTHAEFRLIAHAEPSERTGNTLSLDGLIEEVLARNPSLTQMTAAWQAASARYPQVRSWDDPMFSTMLAPASFGSNSVEPG